MVLGLRSRLRKGASAVQVDYLVHVGEISPWPPSQSLRSVQSIFLQWENGDHNSGSFSSSIGDTSVEFNVTFTLPITLRREKRFREKYQKNFLEFSLFEPKKDKVTKGQLLGTAIINLADYGLIDDIVSISAPVSCKKSSKNTVQPVLFLRIQQVDDKNSSNSSPKIDLSKQVSLDKDRQDSSVSELRNEENDNVSEIASFTDDDDDNDVSSHSSRTFASSAFEAAESPHRSEKVTSVIATENTGRGEPESAPPVVVDPLKPILDPETEAFKRPSGTSHTLVSKDLVPDLGRPANDCISLSEFQERNFTSIKKECDPPVIQSSFSFLQYRDSSRDSMGSMGSFVQENTSDNLHENISGSADKTKASTLPLAEEIFDKSGARIATTNAYTDGKSNQNGDNVLQQRKSGQVEAPTLTNLDADVREGKEEREQQEISHDEQRSEEKRQTLGNKVASKVSYNITKKQGTLRSTTPASSGRVAGGQGIPFTDSKLKHVNPVQLPLETAKANVYSQNENKVRKIGSANDGQISLASTAAASGRKELVNGSDKINEWRSKAEMLEEELREAAALEVGLYSVVAEHGSSINKVHAPARRLSRFYLHACRARSRDKRATAARSAVSGLVLVTKACGNDVPRLTFWLSNSVMLRAIVSKTVGELRLSDQPCIKSIVGKNESDGKGKLTEEFDSWEDPVTFTIALEKVEAWIFSRIVESVWWQTLTPHMQPAAAKSSRTISSSSRKTNGSKHVMRDQEQGNISIELWKKAFKDACERLCPIRAGGHECGCLPVLARLVMEQLVSRLDVAMFNAVLRESAEEMPTDPVSDPIADSKVLPVPSGRSSFGAGAQLKNAIGNWSRWLTDLFGIEDNDSHEDNDKLGHYKGVEKDTSFKPFRLLNALSDLMMLPFEILADAPTRKEVCPTFSAPLIKRVFINFVPDEFCPEPIPNSVIELLDSEDGPAAADESLTVFPCNANPTVYQPPVAASFSSIVGEMGSHELRRSGSSVLRKAYTSDDELDELESPLSLILGDNLQVSQPLTRPNIMVNEKGNRNVVRYQLLREVWRTSN